MIRLVIGALLSAMVLFTWGCLFWVVSPLRFGILRPLPDTVVADLEKWLPQSGVYLSPFPDEDRFIADPKEAKEAFQKRQRQGPQVQISYRKGGVDPLSPVVLGFAFGHLFVSSLLIGGLLLLALPALPSYTSRMSFVFLGGVFAAVTVSLSPPLWFHQPWDLPLFNVLYHASGWFVASFVLAGILRPRKL